MKKIIAGAVTAAILLSLGSTAVFASGRHHRLFQNETPCSVTANDSQYICRCQDTDNDGVCDYRSDSLYSAGLCAGNGQGHHGRCHR